ncbi:MAG TPA: hypothetical protein EYP59_04985 [Thiotrichaceae bacterium]|nr:hypothetical protein [Thiotrichaceae bacterium]
MDTVKIEKNDKKTSTYLELLPAIYQNKDNNAYFLSDFLLIFEQILTGINDNNELKSIGEKLDRVFELFYPYSELMNRPDPCNPNCFTNSLSPYFSPTVDDVLHWMAHCLAFELPENWDLAKKKKLLLKIISIFRKRGTKRGLEEYLSICLGGRQFVHISDDYDCRIQKTCHEYIEQQTRNDSSHLSKPSQLPSNYFIVEVIIPIYYCVEKLPEQIDILKKVIDTEKPVHTNYQLIVTVPIMQIGVNSTVGVNTFLGVRPPMKLGHHLFVGISTLLGCGKDLKPEYVFDSNSDSSCKWKEIQPQFLPNINYETWNGLPLQIGVRSTIGKDTRLSKIPYKNFILYKGGEIILCM